MNNNRLNQRARLKIVLQGFLAPIALLAILLLAAGRWDYWQGWFFMGLTMAILVVNLIVLRHHQEVIAERLAPGEG
jgi:Ca2+/H+ antiporter